MKRKVKIFSTIATLCMCICMLMIGVYAAQSVSFTTTGKINFVSDVVHANITRTVYGNKTDIIPQVYGLEGKERVVNLYDYTKHTLDYRISTTSGAADECEGFGHSDYIPVDANTTYTLNFTYISGADFGMAFYTADKTFIIGQKQGEEGASAEFDVAFTFTTPTNCKYLRFSTGTSSTLRIDEIQLVKGDKLLDYESYDSSNFVTVEGKNLFGNYETHTNSFYNDSGVLSTTEGVDTYSFIKVEPNTSYTISGKSETPAHIRVAQFDESKVFIKREYNEAAINPSLTITTTSTTQYFAISVDVNLTNSTVTNAKVTSIQIEKGVEATAYEEYKEPTTVVKEYLTKDKTIDGNQLDFKNVSTNIVVQFEIENLAEKRGIALTIKDNLNTDSTVILQEIKCRVGDVALSTYDAKAGEPTVLNIVGTADQTTNNHIAIVQIIFSVNSNNANLGASIDYNYTITLNNIPEE